MADQGPFHAPELALDAQAGFDLDDGVGLRVVDARFLSEQKFDWELFEGYESLRVLTYSSSINAIVGLLDRHSFARFECVFGFEGILREMKDILAFQKIAVGEARTAIMSLRDERQARILQAVHRGQASFYVLREYIAHAKLYLLSNQDGQTRVIVGSANLSERAFSGKQPETLVKFDDDRSAWDHYSRMFDRIRDSASDEIPLPEDRITRADIEISETPVMADTSSTLVIETLPPEQANLTVPIQISKVERLAVAVGSSIAAALPSVRTGIQRITPEIKREIARIKLVKSVEEADNRYFSIDKPNRTALLSGKPFPLNADPDAVKNDAALLLDYFKNYEGAFEGNVLRLQRDYFTLTSWLYFSPFMCDMRYLALLQDSDIIRFPSFAIIFGKSNCGKTSLVDTLMTSMFGHAHTVDKQSFTTSKLRALQQGYKRYPVVFDDIGRAAFARHGRDMIKDEAPPGYESPGFILAMNADPQAFPDEVVKRSLMIYTTTALPPQDEALRQRLQTKIQEMRRGMTGHLYRRYLGEIMERLDEQRLPDDWLALSSEVLSRIIADATPEPLPTWCQPITWFDYAEKRYDRVKARLNNLLRESMRTHAEGEVPSGWKIEGEHIIVWEQRDAFGRREFNWEDVPSTLIDEDASGGNRTVLYLASIEEFLGQRLRPSRSWWKPWQ